MKKGRPPQVYIYSQKVYYCGRGILTIMATNQSYYDQASELRLQGYKGKINALSPDTRSYVDTLLEAEKTDTFIAKAVNTRYNLIQTSKFGALSYKAVGSYRKQWERKRFTATEGLKTIFGKDQSFIANLQSQIKSLEIAAKLTHLVVREYDIATTGEKQEDTFGKPMPEVVASRRQAFTMLVNLVRLLQELDLIEKPVEAERRTQDGLVLNEQFLKAIGNLQKEIQQTSEYNATHAKSITNNTIHADTL